MCTGVHTLHPAKVMTVSTFYGPVLTSKKCDIFLISAGRTIRPYRRAGGSSVKVSGALADSHETMLCPMHRSRPTLSRPWASRAPCWV